jgi:hypothetical protein
MAGNQSDSPSLLTAQHGEQATDEDRNGYAIDILGRGKAQGLSLFRIAILVASQPDA